jgi:hypothetical protein
MSDGLFVLGEPRQARYSPLAADHAWGLGPGTVATWIRQGRLQKSALDSNGHLYGDWVEAATIHIGEDGAETFTLRNAHGETWDGKAQVVDEHAGEAAVRELAEYEAEARADEPEAGYRW